MPIDPSHLSPWERIASEPATDYRIFSARIDTMRSPRTGALHRIVVLDAPDWINVVPVTPGGQVVLVRQMRHGLGEPFLEIPGGMVDPGETAEQAAERELLEETGYRAARWRRLGMVHPNPAFQNNRCTTFLAEDCELVTEPAGDLGEDIRVELADAESLPDLVSSGQITHAMVVAALYWYLYDHPRRR